MGKPWTWETIEAAVTKGPHKSAMTTASIALIAKDVAYQVAAGYAQVITWQELCKLRPSNLVPPWPWFTRGTKGELHYIHSMFAQPVHVDVRCQGPSVGEETGKWDARWATGKEILGYWLDGEHRTVQLPVDCAVDLLKEVR
jgi:hypothetical protein